MAKYIILAYANDQKKSLTWLESENNAIHNYFLAHNEGDVTAVPLHEVDLPTFSAGIHDRYKDISILHLSGHSDGNGFYFKDQKVWVDGMAGFVRDMDDIYLVFLNGCGNKDQVEAFHNAGVKAVIATSRAVDDQMASLFSKAFYSGLCKHMTLGKAFNHAVNEIKSRSISINFLAGNARHLGKSPLPDVKKNEDFPWGIYYHKDFSNQELWTLPRTNNGGPTVDAKGYQPTNELVEKVAKHAGRYYASIKENEGESAIDKSIHKEFGNLLDFYLDKFQGTERQRRTLADLVKNMLPFPVAARFERLLRTAADMGRNGNQSPSAYKALINTQLDFYFAMTKLCALTLLSELYELLLNPECKDVKITKDQHAIIRQFFEISEKTKRDFDFASLNKSTREVLENNKSSLFIQEYLSSKNQYAPNGAIFEAHTEICSIRDQFVGGIIDDTSLASYAKQIEDLLWQILENVYFIMRYKLASIKKIELIKYRFAKTKYNHNRIVLHKAIEDKGTNGIVVTDFEPDEFPSEQAHTDSHSVLLFRGLSDPLSVLNITPFIIDINMLSINEDPPVPYMFSYFNKNGAVVFEEVQGQTDQIVLEFDETKIDSEQLDYFSRHTKMYPAEKKNLTAVLKIIRDQYSALKTRLEKIDPAQTHSN